MLNRPVLKAKPTERPVIIRGAALYGGGGQRGGLCQLLHPLHGWRGIRTGMRDGHFHPEAPRPGPYGAGRTVQLQVHHPRQRPDPLNRSNVKAIFRFSLTGRCGRTAACIFVLQGWTVFAIETLSPQNFENYFSVRITMYFSFLHSVQK